jgi:hypothetical protein
MIKKIMLTLGATALLVTPGFAATSHPAEDGWGRNSAYNKKFDPKTVTTVSGTVESVNRDSHPLPGMTSGFSMMLKTDKGKNLEIQLGPKWFTDFYHHKWDIKPGDKFSGTGSIVMIGGHKVMMGMQGRKGDLQATIRNKRGTPIWDLEMSDF